MNSLIKTFANRFQLSVCSQTVVYRWWECARGQLVNLLEIHTPACLAVTLSCNHTWSKLLSICWLQLLLHLWAICSLLALVYIACTGDLHHFTGCCFIWTQSGSEGAEIPCHSQLCSHPPKVSNSLMVPLRSFKDITYVQQTLQVFSLHYRNCISKQNAVFQPRIIVNLLFH